MPLDATHDPLATSWVASANAADCDFPLQNLPFGRFRLGPTEDWRAGVAIGDQVLDLQQAGQLQSADMAEVMQLPAAERHALRLALFEGLRAGNARQRHWELALYAQGEVELGLPCAVGDFTDFYSGIHHARHVGQLFRPDTPLLPNYLWLPIAYHGRASSLVASGQRFHRPWGQVLPAGATAPQLMRTQRLDYELELALWVAQGNTLGEPVPLTEAESHVWGLSLLNDWSARDVQAWEYQPLGPFLAKNFATTVSPWVVTLEALAPFRSAFSHPPGEPQPLPYLDSAANRSRGAFDIQLEVWLQTARMQAEGDAGQRLSRSNSRDAYWTLAQLVTQHTVNGCNLRAGDVLGTGTLSGPLQEQGGTLLELSQGGLHPITLHNGEQRCFLEDGDTVTLQAYAERPGARRIGFGACRGTVLPARVSPGL